MKAHRTIEEYLDIIDLPHPTSERHPRMPAMNRVAQFAPFAALTGYGEAIEEAGDRHEREIEEGPFYMRQKNVSATRAAAGKEEEIR